MTKRGWSGLTEAELTTRLGAVLGVTFEAQPRSIGGGTSAAMASVGEDAWVALQVERRHRHPVENVLQYWPWLERSRRRLVLVHVISPDTKRRDGSRAELTRWLGAMMERVIPGRFAYCRIELGTPEEARQLAAAGTAIRSLGSPLEGRSLIHGA